VPGEIAVVGFDDIEDGRFSSPSLTTICPDKERIATLAVELLADRLEAGPRRDDNNAGKGQAEARELLAPYDLTVRESTAGPRR
jgi:DNA-binding LacI/PurR family transcriptional regulator